MTAVVAMIAIEVATWRSVFMGIELMAEFLLVRRIVTVRRAVHYHVRSGFQAHKEHGENHEIVNERSHNRVSVTQNQQQ